MKSPNSTFRVTDARFGVTIAVQARNASTAYCRYLSAANKRLPLVRKLLHFRNDEPVYSDYHQRMMGHAPSDSDTGGWKGVSIEPVGATAHSFVAFPAPVFTSSGQPRLSKWHRRMVESGRKG
jgi:hypothetical protein